jgi:uncharacterized membrane protein YhiD involved in acid resistance
MFKDFQDIFTFDLSLGEVMMRFVVALIAGLVVALFYRWSHRGTSYSANYVISLVALCLITASVILVIGNNLARAFGLVGAMSIIRFRSAVKETIDIVFIFFSLAMGMAVGVGLHAVAVFGSVFIGVTIWVLTVTRFGRTVKQEFLLQFMYTPGDEAEPPYLDVLRRYAKHHRLVNVKSIGENGELLEISYYLHMKRPEDSGELVQRLGRVPGVNYANLFFDEADV